MIGLMCRAGLGALLLAATAVPAAVLIDTGLRPVVALSPDVVELFTCDEFGDCRQDHEQITENASQFNVAVGGRASSIRIALADDGFSFVSIYRDVGGLLIADPSHLVWNQMGMRSELPLTTGFESFNRPVLQSFQGLNLAFPAGDYWLVMSRLVPSFGRDTVLFAGVSNSTFAERTYLTNGSGGSLLWRYSDRAQASLRIDGVIPEPATWALMIVGFGLVGASARRRRQTAG